MVQVPHSRNGLAPRRSVRALAARRVKDMGWHHPLWGTMRGCPTNRSFPICGLILSARSYVGPVSSASGGLKCSLPALFHRLPCVSACAVG